MDSRPGLLPERRFGEPYRVLVGEVVGQRWSLARSAGFHDAQNEPPEPISPRSLSSIVSTRTEFTTGTATRRRRATDVPTATGFPHSARPTGYAVSNQ